MINMVCRNCFFSLRPQDENCFADENQCPVCCCDVTELKKEAKDHGIKIKEFSKHEVQDDLSCVKMITPEIGADGCYELNHMSIGERDLVLKEKYNIDSGTVHVMIPVCPRKECEEYDKDALFKETVEAAKVNWP